MSKKKKAGRKVKATHPLLVPLEESVAACMKKSGWHDVEVAFKGEQINIKSLGRNGEPEKSDTVHETYVVRLWGKSPSMDIKVFGSLKNREGENPCFAAYNNFADTLSLCNAIGSLPGVKGRATNVSTGHVRIVIGVDNLTAMQGIMFLTRCIDRRYWGYGDTWTLSLSISDRAESPISYMLESEAKGDESYQQAQDLVENLFYHLNHQQFMNGFGLDVSQFKGIETFNVRG